MADLKMALCWAIYPVSGSYTAELIKPDLANPVSACPCVAMSVVRGRQC